MPEVAVFVSATQRDLKNNCLAAVRSVFNRLRDAVSVDMSSWTADHDRPKDICLAKIKNGSTHYIGIFAFRRGWIPPGENLSITELEYREACDKYCDQRQKLKIFVPEEGSDIWLELEKLAGEQTLEEKNAQDQFRDLILKDVCIMFPDVWELRDRVEDVVRRWLEPGSILDLSSSYSIPATGQQIQRLGLRNQLEEFKKTLMNHSPELGLAFVIQGRKGYGQREAAQELAREYQTGRKGEVKRLVADLSDKQDGVGGGNIINGLSRSLNLDLKSVEMKKGRELARALRQELRKHNVLVDIARVDAHKDGVRGVIEFWRKLVGAIPDSEDIQNDLIAVFSVEGQQSVLEPPDPLVVNLPPLGLIEKTEVVAWLRKWADKAEAEDIAEKALDNNSGVPDHVRGRLKDPETWKSASSNSGRQDNGQDYDDDDEGHF